REDHEILRDGDIVYFLDRLSAPDLLDMVVNCVGIPVDAGAKAEILNYRKIVENRERTHTVRLQPTLALKLAAAVGPDMILRRLPRGLQEAFEESKGTLADEAAAELALAVYGIEALHAFRDALQVNGLNPPAVW